MEEPVWTNNSCFPGLRRGDEQALGSGDRALQRLCRDGHSQPGAAGCFLRRTRTSLLPAHFFALWQSCRTVKAGSIRAWLGSVARNKTVDRLRRARMDMPLDEELAGQTIFFSRRLSKRNRRGSCARRSRCSQSRIVRSSGGLRPVPDRTGNRRRAGADPFRGAYAAGTQPGSHQKRVMPGRVCI